MLEMEHNGLTVLGAPSAHVSYVMPTFEELRERFPQYVNPDYRNGGGFSPIDERVNANRSPRELPFRYVRRRSGMSDPATITAMVARGLLPVLPEEELDFLREHPQELSMGRVIWALGARSSGHFLCAWRDSVGRELRLLRTGLAWHKGDLFLAVPREALGALDTVSLT